jgi:hypothetical protein
MSALYAQSGPPSVPRIRGSSRSRMLLPAAWARCVWSGRTDTSSGWGPARPRARLPRILRCLHAGLARRADSYRRGKAAPDRYCGGPNATHADDPAAPRYAARRGSSTVHLRGQDHPPNRHQIVADRHARVPQRLSLSAGVPRAAVDPVGTLGAG